MFGVATATEAGGVAGVAGGAAGLGLATKLYRRLNVLGLAGVEGVVTTGRGVNGGALGLKSVLLAAGVAVAVGSGVIDRAFMSLFVIAGDAPHASCRSAVLDVRVI